MGEAKANGICLNYDVFGDGDPLLLVAGTGQPSFTWQLFQVPALTSAGYRVVTFDNRGVPPSDCPPGPYSVQMLAHDAAGLIEHLGIGPCRVAGISLGAFITQELALARPDLVRAVVMMGTFGRQDVFRRTAVRAIVDHYRSGVDLDPRFEAVLLAFSIFSPTALLDDDRVRQYFEVSAAMGRWQEPGRTAQNQADAAYDGRLEALAGIRVPSLVIGFEHDVLTPAPLSRQVADTIPGCRYVEIPDCGHAGPFERPDEVNDALVEFFATV